MTVFRYMTRSAKYFTHSFSGNVVSAGSCNSPCIVGSNCCCWLSWLLGISSLRTYSHGILSSGTPWWSRYSMIVEIGNNSKCSMRTLLNGISLKSAVNVPCCLLHLRTAAIYFSLSRWNVLSSAHILFVNALPIITMYKCRSVGSSVMKGRWSSLDCTSWKHSRCSWRNSKRNCGLA